MPNSTVVDSKGEQAEYVGPVSRYEVMESKPAASEQRFIAAELDGPSGEAAASGGQRAPAQVAAPRPAKAAAKSSANAAKGTKLVILAGVGLGLMGGLVCAMLFTRPSTQEVTSDMGTVISTATGLKGQLTTSWGDRVNYKLTMGPSDPIYQMGFTNAVINPTRPLQIDLQLRNASGSLLCDNQILLKYDPLKGSPSASAETAPEPPPPGKGKKIDKVSAEVSADQAQVQQALDNAKLVGQELDREHGRDIFASNVGPDGQVTSISSQGTLPCTKNQYEHAASWSFNSNFPIVAQPAKGHGAASSEDDDFADLDDIPTRSPVEARATTARQRVALPASHFSVEEDDQAVSFVASNGTIETRAGKVFQMEKRDQVAQNLKGVDFPIRIHYRCDQLGACALAGLGNGIQRAWLER